MCISVNNNKKKLTPENIESIKYFWYYKEDLDRYCEFEKLKPILKESYPQILKAWEDYKESIENLNKVIDSL